MPGAKPELNFVNFWALLQWVGEIGKIPLAGSLKSAPCVQIGLANNGLT